MSNPYAPPSGAPREGSSPSGGLGGPARPPGDPAPPVRPLAPARPPLPPPDPKVVAAAGRQVTHFVLLVLASLLLVQLPLPWRISSLVFAVTAIVVGILALRAVWRAGVRGPMVSVLVVGLVAAAMMALLLAVSLLFWRQQAAYEACLRDALTISAQETCTQEWQDSLPTRVQTG